MAADITEEFEIDLSAEGETTTLSSLDSSTVAYDISINNLGFILNNTPDEPFRRQTAQFKKDQSDNSSEPGEQSLSGWWLRSQSSFHLGAGVNFYEPVQEAGNLQENQTLKFRFNDSQGVDVFTRGQVSLLNDTFSSAHFTIGTEINNLRSVPQGVLLHDGFDLDIINSAGAVTHFVEYIDASTGLPYAGAEKVFAFCDDGVHAYWITNGGGKWQIWKKPLSSTTASTYTTPGDATKLDESPSAATVTYSYMEWVKERMVLNINNALYEYSGTGALGTTPIYTFNSAGTTVSCVTASGSAIYVAYVNGSNSGILQLDLDPDTLFLTPVGITAEMPRGETITSIKYYLGFVVIGTNKGVRVAQVLDNGSLVYGPLLFESTYACNGIAVSDRFAYAACGVGVKAGLVRIDLSTQIDTLVFPYANDLMFDSSRATHGVAFMASTNILAFTTPKTSSNGAIYIQDPSTYVNSGYITTGRIRFNTLENKLFKFVSERARYDGSTSITVSTIDKYGSTNSLYTGNVNAGNADGTIYPTEPQEFLQFKFTLTSPDNETPYFFGYQVKALPAAKRQRLIQYPLFNYDTQTDKFNKRFGYSGRAYAVLTSLEQIEEHGDLVTITDYRTNETFIASIEDISYTETTPPDKNYSGVGGKLLVTVRKI